MTADAPVYCAKCGASAQVVWSPLWAEYLCPAHLHEQTYRDLDATVRPLGWTAAVARDVEVMVR